MLDKSSVYNVLAEGMFFRIKVTREISTILTFQSLPEVAQIPHVNFETRSQFLYKHLHHFVIS